MCTLGMTLNCFLRSGSSLELGGMWSNPSLTLLPGHYDLKWEHQLESYLGSIKLVSCVWHQTASDGEIPVLELGGMWMNPSLTLLPGPLWPKVVAPVRISSKGQSKLLSWVWHQTASDGEVPVLELGGMWMNPSLTLLPDPLWPIVVALVRISMGQSKLVSWYDTKLHLMVRLQSWNFEECGITFYFY